MIMVFLPIIISQCCLILRGCIYSSVHKTTEVLRGKVDQCTKPSFGYSGRKMLRNVFWGPQIFFQRIKLFHVLVERCT